MFARARHELMREPPSTPSARISVLRTWSLTHALTHEHTRLRIATEAQSAAVDCTHYCLSSRVFERILSDTLRSLTRDGFGLYSPRLRR